jgi:hypothetical protein
MVRLGTVLAWARAVRPVIASMNEEIIVNEESDENDLIVDGRSLDWGKVSVFNRCC